MKRDAKTDTAAPKTCVICKTEISGNYAEMPEGITCIPCWLEEMRHRNFLDETRCQSGFRDVRTMRQITITIPGKIHPSLNALNRMHWAAKQRLKKEWEEEIFWLTRAADWRGEPIRKALVVISYFAGDKRRRDHDNVSPKFLMDGLVKAGVLEDDNAKAVKVQWTIFEQGPRRTEIRVMEV